MAADVILAIDQGTTNTKALLVDRAGVPVFRVSVPVGLQQPRPGFVEQDAGELWRSVEQAIAACIVQAAKGGLKIQGIAISNQRETAVAWRRGAKLEPVAPAISWQCRRSAPICEELARHGSLIRDICGLPIDPLASAGKWAWLLRDAPTLREQARRGEVCFGNIDAWLLANLTGGIVHATDHSNASRTGLFSLHDRCWSERLLGLYDVPLAALPFVQPSSSRFGVCRTIAELAGVPIVAMIGDSHAALVGHGSFVPGAVKATYGTGSSLMLLTSSLVESTAALARTIAWSDADGIRFALDGNIPMTGSAVQWVGEFLGLASPVDDTAALAETVPNAAGLEFVPAMVGLGAPYWDTRARGLVANLERPHRAAHLARAALDSVAFQVADVLFAMERLSGVAIPALRVDGGATRNAALMQFQANVIGRPVLRSAQEELSALGAAWLGGLTLGWWPHAAALEALPQPATEFHPDVCAAEAVRGHRRWHTAVERACLRPEAAIA